MEQPRSRPPATLEEERERKIRELSAHFSRDHLPVEELERRIDGALAAGDSGALAALTSDLPALPPDALPADTAEEAEASGPALGPRVLAGVTPREHDFVLALMGGSSRKGVWTPPRKLRTFAAMGGVVLDFREARFGSEVVEVEVFACMGGTEIVVPPGVRVDAHGLGIMGGFDNRAPDHETGDPRAPLVRVRGLAIMGGITIDVREPGESERQAKRRRRRERRHGRH